MVVDDIEDFICLAVAKTAKRRTGSGVFSAKIKSALGSCGCSCRAGI